MEGNNLIIGNSQLSHYFPKDYITISSRNIDKKYLMENKWDSVYITFAEQRIYDNNIDFITPNCKYTLELIDILIKNSNKITVYLSSELWNNVSGEININTPVNFKPTGNDYALSKYMLFERIKELRVKNNDYNKVVVLAPFYFNSIYRNEYFLFGKVFNSIINKKKIELSNINFFRDISHAKYVAERSINSYKDDVIGSGNLINVRTYIKDLYYSFNMYYNDYVIETNTEYRNINLFYTKNENIYLYKDLLNDTINDIKTIVIK